MFVHTFVRLNAIKHRLEKCAAKICEIHIVLFYSLVIVGIILLSDNGFNHF